MKTLISIFAPLFILALSANAQERLWTWKPSGGQKFRTLHAVSFSADGGAAFVIAVNETTYPYPGHYLLVWVNSNGKELLSKKLPASGDVIELQRLYTDSGTPWEIVLFSPKKLVLKDANEMRLFESIDGAITAKTLELKHDALLFGGGAFEGWLQRETSVAGGIAGAGKNGKDGKGFDIDSLTAWKL